MEAGAKAKKALVEAAQFRARIFLYENAVNYDLVRIFEETASKESYQGRPVFMCHIVFTPNYQQGPGKKEIYVMVDESAKNILGAYDANRKPLQER